MLTFGTKLAITIVGVTSICLAAACSNPRKSPDQICSSKETYDDLHGIISQNSNGALVLLDAVRDRGNPTTAKFLSVLDLEHIKKHVEFYTPLVTNVNKNTGSVSCSVRTSLKIPKALLLNLNSSGLQSPSVISKVDDTSIELIASYNVQGAADGSGNVVSLQNAQVIASFSGVATIYNELIRGKLSADDQKLMEPGLDTSSGNDSLGLTKKPIDSGGPLKAGKYSRQDEEGEEFRSDIAFLEAESNDGSHYTVKITMGTMECQTVIKATSLGGGMFVASIVPTTIEEDSFPYPTKGDAASSEIVMTQSGDQLNISQFPAKKTCNGDWIVGKYDFQPNAEISAF